MGDTYDQDKRLVRSRIRAQRAQLAPDEVVRMSEAACARVLASPWFGHADHVAAYAAVDNELDPAALVRAALSAGKRVYLPAADRARVDFVAIEGAGERSGPSLAPDADWLLCLVPGLAFEAQGGRLDRGSGWYDRALARHPRAFLVGLAYEFQLAPHLPQAPWDVRMHAIATEARLIEGAPGL